MTIQYANVTYTSLVSSLLRLFSQRRSNPGEHSFLPSLFAHCSGHPSSNTRDRCERSLPIKQTASHAFSNIKTVIAVRDRSCTKEDIIYRKVCGAD